jgi:hypothetical protein
MVRRDDAGAWRVETADVTPELVSRLAARLAEHGVLLRELTVGRPSLEEVFLELTREERT